MTNRNARKYTVKAYDADGKRVYKTDTATIASARKLAREFMRLYVNVHTVSVYNNTAVMNVKDYCVCTYVKLSAYSGLLITNTIAEDIRF